ncbi:MAG: hypothetical protein Q7K57_51825 [Burkholderiaceae bacterium]|nr:hypothetical protein [Burkholderiaceae bacterium]
MKIRQSIASPPTPSEDWHERWEGSDQGLVCSWLHGIEKAQENPELATKAKAGELPVLAWRGGVEKPIKSKTKTGAMTYLATWQGLRGEDLDIDPDIEVSITCSRTGVPVLFTNQIHKLLQNEESEDA